MEVRRIRDDELQHHGVKGQRWGVRRYQNADGSLTAAGKKRYYKADGTLTIKGNKEYYTQHFENKLKKAKTKDEKAYILRSEARKNNVKILNTLKTGLGVTAANIGIGAASTVGAAFNPTFAIPAAIAFGSAATSFYATIGASVANTFIAANKDTKLADLADKYGIEDIKVRTQSNK